MSFALCFECNKEIKDLTDKVGIFRQGAATLVFHTDCFIDVAGEQFLPQPGPSPGYGPSILKICRSCGCTLNKINKAPNGKHCLSCFNPNSIIASQQDLQKFAQNEIPQLAINCKTAQEIELVVDLALQQRVPLGIKTSVTCTMDPVTVGYRIQIDYIGHQKWSMVVQVPSYSYRSVLSHEKPYP